MEHRENIEVRLRQEVHCRSGLPTLYFFGRVSGGVGLYRSLDFFATEPQLLARFPMGYIDLLTAIEGDKNIFGRVYLGFNGSGWMYGDYGFRVNAV